MKRDRSWVFMLTGIACAITSALAWYLSWHYSDAWGASRLDEGTALAAYLVSLLSLILWLVRLSDRKLVYAGSVLVVAGLLLFAFSWLASENSIEFFAISRKLVLGKSLGEYDHRYVVNWSTFFR